MSDHKSVAVSTLKSLAIPILVLVVWLAWLSWERLKPPAMVLQGQIEAQEYSVSSKVPGRVNELMVRRGDPVSIGDPVFEIDSPEVAAKMEQAAGAADAAGAMADAARVGARQQELEAARDQWQTARAARELAEKTYNRMLALVEEGVLPEQRRDEAFAAFQAARFTEDAAFQLFSMAQEGARAEVISAADGQQRSAAGLVAEVEAAREELLVRSRWDGEIANVLLHEGELAPQGFPVVTVVDMKDAWALFQVREDLLAQFPKDSVWQVTLPALGGQTVEMRVSAISVLGDFATWRASHGSGPYDLRTFEVELRPINTIDGLRAGMSALIAIPPQ